MSRAQEAKAGRVPPGRIPSGRVASSRVKGPAVLSIRVIATSVAVGITAMAVLAVGAVQERHTRGALTREIEMRLLLEARNLALASATALLNDFPELTLHPLAKEMQAEQPELSLVVVADHNQVVQGHSDSRLLGTALLLPDGLQPEPTDLDLRPGESMEGNRSEMVASSPVSHGTGQVIGTVAVGIHREYIDKIVRAAHRQQSIVLAIVLAIGVGAAFTVMSVLLRPVGALRAGLERIGRGQLDTPIRLRNRTELGMLAATVDDMACRLSAAQAQMVEKERLAHELELATQIQRSLLPKSRVIAEQFLIEGAHDAASEVGGDYYDVFPLADGRIGVAVADVAGKGLAGCLVMSMLSVLLRAYRDQHDSPADLLVRLDERLGESLQPGSFVTMFYGVLTPTTGRLVFASAGHLPTFVFRSGSGEVEQFATRGIPLAAIRGGAIRRTLKDEEVHLGAGDMLMQYTDGVNEAFDAAGREQFDFERVKSVLVQKGWSGGRFVLDELRRRVDDWRGGTARLDDETLLIVSREVCVALEGSGPERGTPRRSETAEALRWLADAREHGEHLGLTASLDEVDRVLPWVQARHQLQDLTSDRRGLLAAALYEACANIAEHGYEQKPDAEFQLWWVPGRGRSRPASPSVLDFVPRSDSHDPGKLGYFLILDRGTPFSDENWAASDLHDPRVRRRLRGFGLDIIHRVMSRVVYRPATPEGNVTLLGFDAADDFEGKERDLING